jgi:hypothetical protein
MPDSSILGLRLSLHDMVGIEEDEFRSRPPITGNMGGRADHISAVELSFPHTSTRESRNTVESDQRLLARSVGSSIGQPKLNDVMWLSATESDAREVHLRVCSCEWVRYQ